jgi:hypothetical protein
MMNETQTTIDCIELKNDIQRQILDETVGMSQKDLLEYFNAEFMYSRRDRIIDGKDARSHHRRN